MPDDPPKTTVEPVSDDDNPSRTAIYLRGLRNGMTQAAQIAVDQSSDEPSPGTWNEACAHISALLKSRSATYD